MRYLLRYVVFFFLILALIGCDQTTIQGTPVNDSIEDQVLTENAPLEIHEQSSQEQENSAPPIQPIVKKEEPPPQQKPVEKKIQKEEEQLSCTPSWDCGEWSSCIQSKKKRTCTDSNNCQQSSYEDVQGCQCQPLWDCTDWSECVNNQQSRVCTSKNNCDFSPKTELQSCEQESFSQDTIQIIGINDCKSKTNEALRLLNDKSSSHYSYVLQYIGIVECAEDQSGMFVWEEPPRFLAGAPTVDAGTLWFASVLVHESCHSQQYQDYTLANPGEVVPQDTYYGEGPEVECLDKQQEALIGLDSDPYYIGYVEDQKSAGYWHVPYDEREW